MTFLLLLPAQTAQTVRLAVGVALTSWWWRAAAGCSEQRSACLSSYHRKSFICDVKTDDVPLTPVLPKRSHWTLMCACFHAVSVMSVSVRFMEPNGQIYQNFWIRKVMDFIWQQPCWQRILHQRCWLGMMLQCTSHQSALALSRSSQTGTSCTNLISYYQKYSTITIFLQPIKCAKCKTPCNYTHTHTHIFVVV